MSEILTLSFKLFSIISLWAFLHSKVNHKSLSLLLTCSLLILLNLILGFYNYLNLSTYSFMALGAASLIYIKFKRQNGTTLKYRDYIFIPILILVFIFLYLKTQGLLINSWDEFSYWGLIDKEIHYHGTFPTEQFLTKFKEYPLAQPLFHFFFLDKISFKENLAYYAQAILLIIPVFGFIYYNHEAKLKNKVIFLYLFIVSHFIWANGMHTLMIDSVVASFSLLIFLIFLDSPSFKIKSLDALAIIVICLVIPQLKQISAIIAILILICSCIESLIKNKFKLTADLAFTTMAIIAVLLSYYSWQLYVKHQGFNVTFKATNMSVVQFLKEVNLGEEKVRFICTQFIKAFFYKKSTYSPHLWIGYWSFFHHLLFLFAFSGLVYFQTKNYKWLRLQIYLCFIFFAYAFLHLLVYIYAMDDNSGRTLASFERYMNIILLMWYLAQAYFLFISELFTKNKITFLKLILVLFILAHAPKAAILYPKLKIGEDSLVPERRLVLEAKKNISQFNPDLSKTYLLIVQQGRGFEQFIANFELYPRKQLISCSSFGKKYYENDIWTCDITEDEFMQYIQSTDLIYIANPDENFCHQFKNIFKNNCLNYKLYQLKKENHETFLEPLI